MEIILALQSAAHPMLDSVALALTNLGSEEAYIALLLIGYVAVDARSVRIVGLGLLGSFYLNQLLKEAFDTVRPYVEHPELLRSEGAYRTAPGPAFPSGHAQSATTFWGLAAVLGRRGWLTALALAMIATIGATRVYLGVHWPLDVVGGTLIGAAVVAVVAVTARRGPTLGTAAQLLAFVALPLGVHLALPTPESGIIAGGIAGFGTAPLLLPHRARGSWWRRGLVGALGLTLAFGWLFATSALLPEAVKDHPLGAPLRYWMLAWAGLVATPWLADRARLLPPARKP